MIPRSTVILILLLYHTTNGQNGQRVPSAPRNLKAELVGPDEVKLSWEPPAHANGQLKGYYVYKERLENGETVGEQLQKASAIMDPKKLYAVIDGLEPNREYAFRVSGFNRNGDGQFSERRTIVTGGLPPRKPEVLSVDLLSPKDVAPLKAKLSWKPPHLAPLEAPVDRFNIWYRRLGSPSYTKLSVSGGVSEVELTGLRMAQQYEILLGAESTEGMSVNATESLVTPIGNPDAEPINVQYEIVNGKMRLSWDAPSEQHRHGNITTYKAILTPMDSDGERLEKEVSTNHAIFTVDHNKAYTFKVAASTMTGQGPFSPVLQIDPNPDAMVGPPGNVRVEAISNSSAVVQWDFESGQSADGFVVKYMHEPRGRADTDRWIARTIMDSTARSLVIPQLTSHKPYAFCVLAIKQNRQGSCSDPPITIERLSPTYMVSNLVVEWKTANSARVKWDYNGPQPVTFFLNYTGRKEYLDQNLSHKTLTAAAIPVEVDGNAREFLFTKLRAHMRYSLQVSVKTRPPGMRQYWPAETNVTTSPDGPPPIEAPFIENTANKPGQITARLHLASEEYGPISHYWLIVVPGNTTTDDVMNLDNSFLERSTQSKKASATSSVAIQPAKKLKKRQRDGGEESDEWESKRKRRELEVDLSLELVSLIEEQEEEEQQWRRRSDKKRSLPQVHGAYITAKLDADEMRNMFREKGSQFVVGDQQMYNGFINFPLKLDEQYKLMLRAFAAGEVKGLGFDQRPPMTERGTKLHADSQLSDVFSPKTGGTGRGGDGTGAKSQVWLIGPLGILAFIFVLIGMLIFYWWRCKSKSVGRGSTRHHGSITKVAIGGHHINGNGPSGEMSKLLTNDYGQGRGIMHPYEQMNTSTSLDHLYPIPSSHSRPFHQTNGNGITSGYTTMNVPLPHLPSSGGVIGGYSLSHPPVPITELAAHIERLRANNNAGFVQEFESIETGQQFTWEASSAEYNKHKNRYANVVAYDHSRVILSAVDGIPGSDYINANYIDGYERTRAYIASQGPLPETFDDFWRMVWEEGSATIVMLTNLEEQNRIKCDQYWPTRGTGTYGDIDVSLIDTTVLAHYTMRTFHLQMAGEKETREIKHLQYTAWPDHGVPDHPTPFLVFLKRVKTLNPPEAGPIISHCSAGIGRTGAFIVIDCMLERLRYEHTLDIFGCVTALRAQRTYMVQIDDQYSFIHDAVLDAVLSGSTEVPSKRLTQHVNALMAVQMDGMSPVEQEFRQLNNFQVQDSRCIEANLPVNRHKNRAMNVVPYDNNRVMLSTVPGVEGSDYINASWVDGYRERYAYIATQAPGEATLFDFWRMVWEHEAGIIVVLKMSHDGNGRDHSQSRHEYWPSEQGVQVGQNAVEPIAEYNMPQYILREFKITDLQSKLSRTIRHFEYTEWPEMNPAPKNPDPFIDFVQQVHRTKTQFGVDGPIIVHCATGAGRTGVFIALAQIIDRIRLENAVDVFTTVKLLRTERQGMVQEREQYQFLYLAVREYLSAYDQPI